MAKKHTLLIGDFRIETWTPSSSGFPIATFEYQRVDAFLQPHLPHLFKPCCSTPPHSRSPRQPGFRYGVDYPKPMIQPVPRQLTAERDPGMSVDTSWIKMLPEFVRNFLSASAVKGLHHSKFWGLLLSPGPKFIQPWLYPQVGLKLWEKPYPCVDSVLYIHWNFVLYTDSVLYTHIRGYLVQSIYIYIICIYIYNMYIYI